MVAESCDCNNFGMYMVLNNEILPSCQMNERFDDLPERERASSRTSWRTLGWQLKFTIFHHRNAQSKPCRHYEHSNGNLYDSTIRSKMLNGIPVGETSGLLEIIILTEDDDVIANPKFQVVLKYSPKFHPEFTFIVSSKTPAIDCLPLNKPYPCRI